MPYCSAFGCNSRLTKGCGIHFHKFPKTDYSKQWIHYCRREDLTQPGPNHYLCSKHFSSAQYKRDPKWMAEYGYENARPLLFDHAVPDIPLEIPSKKQEVKKRTQPSQGLNRGAYQKRRRAEVLSSIFEEPPSTSVSDESQDNSAQEQQDMGSSIDALPTVETSSETVVRPRTTRSVGFQIKPKRPKMNTKRYQIKPSVRTFPVQASPLVRSVGTQYDIKDVPEEAQVDDIPVTEEPESDTEYDNDKNDGDYIPSESDGELDSDEELNDKEIHSEELLSAKEPNKERQFLVAESCLLSLLNKCKTCGHDACVTMKGSVGTMIIVDILCTQGHDYTWRSQVCNNSMPWGNLLLASAILFSGSSPAKVLTLFHHLNVPVFTPRTYSNLQYSYLVPAVLRTWDTNQADLITDLQGKALAVGGDARCDSPGHSAKYGSYSLMTLDDTKVLHVELVQSNEVKGSYHMELEGLKRALDYIDSCGLAVSEIVTDRHVQVKKYMNDKQADKDHYFDVWHVAKGVSKKLEQAAKKKECAVIRPWIKSTVNHLYWIAASCGKNGPLKKAKWVSITNHVSDKHEGHGDLFPRCEHGPIDEQKKWIKSGSRAYKAFVAVVHSPYLLRDLAKLSPIHQTYGLEVYHNIVNHFAAKSTHFFFESMLARVHLAALHFNENSGKKQSVTKAGEPQYRVCYPKAKKGEEAVIKEKREGPTYGYVQELLEVVVSRRCSLTNYKRARLDAASVIGDIPEPVRSQYKKFDKKDLVEKHKSRFVKQGH